MKLLNMFINLHIPASIPNNLTQLILLYDRSDMLDELIRHAGKGIDLKTVRQDSEKDAIPVNDQNKLLD